MSSLFWEANSLEVNVTVPHPVGSMIEDGHSRQRKRCRQRPGRNSSCVISGPGEGQSIADRRGRKVRPSAGPALRRQDLKVSLWRFSVPGAAGLVCTLFFLQYCIILQFQREKWKNHTQRFNTSLHLPGSIFVGMIWGVCVFTKSFASKQQISWPFTSFLKTIFLKYSCLEAFCSVAGGWNWRKEGQCGSPHPASEKWSWSKPRPAWSRGMRMYSVRDPWRTERIFGEDSVEIEKSRFRWRQLDGYCGPLRKQKKARWGSRMTKKKWCSGADPCGVSKGQMWGRWTLGAGLPIKMGLGGICRWRAELECGRQL